MQPHVFHAMLWSDIKWLGSLNMRGELWLSLVYMYYTAAAKKY
jgi:hypothetical protein